MGGEIAEFAIVVVVSITRVVVEGSSIGSEAGTGT
jgi:hypothetical protein